MYLRLERLIQDHVAWVVLDVLPAGIAMTGAEGASREEPASRQHARCPAATPRCQTPSLLVTAPSPQLPRPAEASLASQKREARSRQVKGYVTIPANSQ